MRLHCRYEAQDLEERLKEIVWWLVENAPDRASELITTFGKAPLEIMAHQDSVSASDPFGYLDDNILTCLKALDSAGAGSDDQVCRLVLTFAVVLNHFFTL